MRQTIACTAILALLAGCDKPAPPVKLVALKELDTSAAAGCPAPQAKPAKPGELKAVWNIRKEQYNLCAWRNKKKAEYIAALKRRPAR